MDITKEVVHYGYLPLILYLGMVMHNLVRQTLNDS